LTVREFIGAPPTSCKRYRRNPCKARRLFTSARLDQPHYNVGRSRRRASSGKASSISRKFIGGQFELARHGVLDGMLKAHRFGNGEKSRPADEKSERDLARRRAMSLHNFGQHAATSRAAGRLGAPKRCSFISRRFLSAI
jgi:hypothetical protein